MDLVNDVIGLKELRLNKTMSREDIMKIITAKYGHQRPLHAALSVFQTPPICICLEYVEEALYRFVKDEETLLVHVLCCLMMWSEIDSCRRNAGEDRKRQLSNWMVGKVTDTAFMETVEANEGSTNEAKGNLLQFEIDPV